MDNMLEHPWTELQLLIKEKWLTQKAFASILWKKVSEVNELLKWKRNITIQRDYLLHQTLWTPIKYWILKQVDYDYSLLDIEEESSVSPLEKEELGDTWSHSEQSKESCINNVISNDSEKSTEQIKDETQIDFSLQSKWQSNTQNSHQDAEQVSSQNSPEWQTETQVKSEETLIQKPPKKIDEDHQKRAKIFKSF